LLAAIIIIIFNNAQGYPKGASKVTELALARLARPEGEGLEDLRQVWPDSEVFLQAE
jgi:hypothetical protein